MRKMLFVALTSLPLLLTHSICSLSSEYGGLQILHSFPTRRSSDLHGVDGAACAVAVAREVPAHRHRGGVAAPDRKSTRLNSSHVEISYAVFCLKKKKKNITIIASRQLLPISSLCTTTCELTLSYLA